MKFNFKRKGKTSVGNGYQAVKAGPATQTDLYMLLLPASLPAGDPPHTGNALGLLRTAIRQSDPEFLERMAIYLREQRNFRDLSFLLTAELAALYDKDEKTGQLVGRVVQQAGEIPAWLEHYARTDKKSQRPGRAVRRNLSALLNRLDEYQYGRLSAEVREGLKQALKWLRPGAVNRSQKLLFGRILRGQVPVRTTWEREWQALHQQHYDNPEQRQVALRDKWKEGISSFRIGYTALLDNLQPMLSAGVSGKVLKLAAEYLGNAAAAGPDGQSPLRLLKVYRTLQGAGQGGTALLTAALEQAALHNSWNCSDFGRHAVSLVAMDVSNSMKQPLTGYDPVQRFDIGPLLVNSWKSRGDQVLAGIIGNTWRPLEEPLRPILSAVDRFRRHEGEAGYAINAWLILQDLLRKRQAVDNVLVFTDCRLWNNRTFNQPSNTDLGDWWREYRIRVAPRARLYLFDLAGPGIRPLEIAEDDVYLVSGWQDRIFDVLRTLQDGKNLS